MKHLPHSQKRCMDCKELMDYPSCLFSSGEDQLACDLWKPHMTKIQRDSLLKEYKAKKHQKTIKAIWKYMEK